MERFNRVLGEGLRARTEVGLQTALSDLLTAYRTTPHATTGVTPAALMLGRELRTQLRTLAPPIRIAARPPASVQEHVERRQARYKADADRRHRAKPSGIRVGDHVRVRVGRRGSKLAARRGPVRRVVGVKTTSVSLDDGTTWHMDRCRLVPAAATNTDDEDSGVDDAVPMAPGAAPPQPVAQRRSHRARRRPQRYPEVEGVWERL